MKLLLNTLPAGKTEEIFDTLEPLINAEGIDWEPLELSVKLIINNQDPNFYLQGEIFTRGKFVCGKGLEPFEDTLNSKFNALVTYNEKEYEEDDEDIFLMKQGKVVFDLDDLIREAVIISRPISHYCGDNCPEYEKLIALSGAEQDIDARWSDLRDMFKEETN